MKKTAVWPLALIIITSFTLARTASYMFVIALPVIDMLLSVIIIALALTVIARFRKQFLIAFPFLLVFLAVLYPTGFYTWCEKVVTEYSAWMWNCVPHPTFERLTVFMIALAATLPVFILIRCHSPAPILLFAGGILFYGLEKAGYAYPIGLFWPFMLCVLLQMTLIPEPRQKVANEEKKPAHAGTRMLMVLPFSLLIVWAAGAFVESGADPLRRLRDMGQAWVGDWGESVGVFGSGMGNATDATDIGSELGGAFLPSGEVMLSLRLGASVNFTLSGIHPPALEYGSSIRGIIGGADGPASSVRDVLRTEVNGTFERTWRHTLGAPLDAPYLRGGIGLIYDGRRWQPGGTISIPAVTDNLLSTSSLEEPYWGQLRELNGYTIQQEHYRGKRLYMPVNLVAAEVSGAFNWNAGDVYTLRESPAPYYQYTAVTSDATSGRNASLPDENLDDYTQLPTMLPQRVRSLARRFAVYEEDYYNALAIEQYLMKTYTYNPDMPATPAGEDFVDFFLHEQGEGHCVYFASAMTVLCRAAGLPARYVEGFAPTDKQDEDGRYLYTDEVAHAWCEVYLGAEQGWVQFEPTPGYNRAEQPVWFPEPIAQPVTSSPPPPSPSMDLRPSVSPLAPVEEAVTPFPWVPLTLILLSPVPPILCWRLLRLRRQRFVHMMRSLPYTQKQANRVYKHILWLAGHAHVYPKPHETIWEFADRTDAAWPNKQNVSRLAADAYGKTCYGTSPLTLEESETLLRYAELLESRENIHLSAARLYIYKNILSLL